jgi:uroporphyrinogen III methyltransferase/synthase
MTARSLELIARADAILYDRLIPPGALDGARADCELRYVGKEPGNAAMAQADIEALLVELGGRGLEVVRLKGGDPFVFGRGGEEAEALAAAGVAFEVVPGVTAGIAAPAYAGVPVTHRDAASAVAFVTGHEDPEKGSNDSASMPNPSQGSNDSASMPNPFQGSNDSASMPNPFQAETALDWGALARFPGTLVFYMGVKNLPLIARRLIAAGRNAHEPVAVVRRGTHPDQETVTAPLEQIAQRVSEAGLRAPAITVVGAVAGLRDTLAWVERRPLHGRRIAVTRARAQASGLAARLRALGAEVAETPAIRIEPRAVEGELERAVEEIAGYALVVLTSPNGAQLLFDALAARGLDARALSGVTVAAIGPGTARELERRGVRADVVPPRSIAESLAQELERIDVDGRRVLIARASEARDILPEALAARGAEVDVVALYDTVAEPLDDAQREALAAADVVTFTSSSTVRFLLEALGSPRAALDGARVVSIGPVTSATARELGLEVATEATRHDIDGLVDALIEDAAT